MLFHVLSIDRNRAFKVSARYPMIRLNCQILKVLSQQLHGNILKDFKKASTETLVIHIVLFMGLNSGCLPPYETVELKGLQLLQNGIPNSYISQAVQKNNINYATGC